MDKRICCMCRVPEGSGGGMHKIADGYICGKCLRLCCLKGIDDLRSYKFEKLENLRQKNMRLHGQMDLTIDKEGFLQIDENTQTIYADGTIFKYKNLVSCSLVKDNQTITSSGLGSAVAGGLLFGDSGAIAGAVVGKNIKQYCSSLKIIIALKDTYASQTSIDFISTSAQGIEMGSTKYNELLELAYSCMNILNNIIVQNQQALKAAQIIPTPAPAFSSADEILKFKNLMDQGIITPAEFEAKKKQLLGL